MRGGGLAVFTYAARGAVGAMLLPTGVGTTFVFREIPLTPEADGTDPVALGLDPLGFVPGLSMRDDHGTALGDDPRGSRTDVMLQRLGCEP